MKVPKRLAGNTPSHQRAPVMEKELAVRFGGRLVRGSGSGSEKGDVRVEKLIRIEAKATKHGSFSITRNMVEKIENAALPSGEVPVIIVEFLDDAGKVLHELAVLPTWAVQQTITRKDEPAE